MQERRRGWGKKVFHLRRCFSPTPVVLVTCVDETGKANIITLAWVGVVNSEPPMIGTLDPAGTIFPRLCEAIQRVRGQSSFRRDGQKGGCLRYPFREGYG